MLAVSCFSLPFSSLKGMVVSYFGVNKYVEWLEDKPVERYIVGRPEEESLYHVLMS